MKTPLSMIALFVVGNAFAGALDNWHWRNPLPTSAQLHDVTFGGDQFVAVGDGGSIVTSTDGENWTARSSGSQAALNGVAYGNGKFLAFGDEGTNGVVLTSPDGLTWTLSIAQTASGLRQVIYDRGMFVGVGTIDFQNGERQPRITTSLDGQSWTNQTSVPVLDALNGIAYGNGTFVAVGDRGLIVTSADGLNWTETG